MTINIDEVIKRFRSNAAYERADGNLQGYLEFMKIADWLDEYREICKVYCKWNRNYNIQTSSAFMEIMEILETHKAESEET